MSISNTLRTDIIATSANAAVYTAGQPIYSSSGVWGSKSTVLVPPGVAVFYNPATGLSTGTAATPSTVPLLKVGVAVDYDGDGQSDDIIWFNEGMASGDFLNHSGRSSKCGLPNIKQVVWGANCFECNKTYTIRVDVSDPVTEAFGRRDTGAYTYHFSYTPPCSDCTTGDCLEAAVNADEVMCGLYNKIKGITHDPNWDITLNSLPLPENHEYRFDVAMLYDGAAPAYADNTTLEYCLTAADATCENCSQYTAIGGYSLDGDPDVVFSPATFSGTDPDEYSTKAQIESAVAQLNEALGGNGTAIFLPAVGNCCTNNKIEINTCLTAFELHGPGGAADLITPCQESNPFSTDTTYAQCQDCNSANSTFSPVAGLRFFSKPVSGECDCIAGNQALVEYFSELDVAVTDGFVLSNVRVATMQDATLPENQGFQWQSKEIGTKQLAFHEPFVTGNWTGKFGYPEPNDLLNRVTVDCTERYCVLGAVVARKTRHDNTGETSYVKQTIHLLIPDDHTTAKTSILTAWNAYFGAVAGTITCAS